MREFFLFRARSRRPARSTCLFGHIESFPDITYTLDAGFHLSGLTFFFTLNYICTIGSITHQPKSLHA